MKLCYSCGITKSTSDFGSHARFKDGLQPSCKQCTNARNRGEPPAKERQARYCKQCNEEKPLVAYATASARFCISCLKANASAQTRRWYAANRERKSMSNKRWQKANPEQLKKIWTKYRNNNKEQRRLAINDWRRRNPDRAMHHFVLANANRRARKARAIATWANHFFINEIYALARLRTNITGYQWHVDHIVPLYSPVVCGLHCEANLQIVSATHNRKKSNVTWPNMPEALCSNSI